MPIVSTFATDDQYLGARISRGGFPDELSAPGADWTYSDEEVNRAMDEIADDLSLSRADAIARAELADAKAWLATLTGERVTISRSVTDSGLLDAVSTSYTVCIWTSPTIGGTGETAMDAARDAARKLSASKVA